MSEKPRLRTTTARACFVHLTEAEEYKGKFHFKLTGSWDDPAEIKDLKVSVRDHVFKELGITSKDQLPDGWSWPWKSNRPSEKTGDYSEGMPEGGVNILFKRKEDFGPPVVVGPNPRITFDEEKVKREVYPGCLVQIGCVPFLYDEGPRSRGVTLCLEAVQKVGDGERIFGGDAISPSDFFDTHAGGGGSDDVDDF